MEDPSSADSLEATNPQASDHLSKHESTSGGDQEIEPNDVEMKDETDSWTAPDGSFSKRIIKKGSGFTTPNDGASCQVTISIVDPLEDNDVGYPTGEQVDIVLGDGCGRFSEAIDACLETMHQGEESELRVFDEHHVESVDQTHGSAAAEFRSEAGDGQISNGVATFRVTLHSFTRNKDIHKMSVGDILTRVSQLKDYGTTCFKERKLQLAERFYIRAGRYLIMVCHPQDVKDLDDEERQQYLLLKKGCSLNLAACHLKQKRYDDVITHCTIALEIEPLNAKALFRRCQAYLALDEFEKTRTDIQTALGEDPESRLFLEQKRLLGKRERKVFNNLSRGMNKMFGGPS
ncbi:peptidyl-prolyl cis-trans isomerase FKBP62 [Strongylocentrotus purpuratus]|uniref:Peptidylprolyl isomerase n=1 Tax=Strongylocentrotus purpuratus TaxID=7668 RepID=A0A7M7GFM1_STRPU|nr:peptidyl-prolyl cis-trans isomerase FKBP62 [Strongylocentrotus purpuratus]|eukprot:XP_003723927.1 PREDICTED: peptidyl-prolyl cis-trans isomerase FKBP62-like [Strongylocentrotus purpuratus]